MVIQFRNLVFEGGGVKGIAYTGAMQILEQRGILTNIRRVGGTSAGAINALVYALGYNVTEQTEILNSVDFKKFMDDSFGMIRDVRRLAKHFGWHKGGYDIRTVQELLGYNVLMTTMIYAHVLNRGGKGVRSLVDAL